MPDGPLCPLATSCWGMAIPHSNRAGQTRGPTTQSIGLSFLHCFPNKIKPSVQHPHGRCRSWQWKKAQTSAGSQRWADCLAEASHVLGHLHSSDAGGEGDPDGSGGASLSPVWSGRSRRSRLTGPRNSTGCCLLPPPRPQPTSKLLAPTL